jgi:mannan endo-1,4-beta-mannosidase
VHDRAAARLKLVLQTDEDIEKGLKAAREAKLKVFRTWGFNDKNVTYNPDGLPKYGDEGAGATEVVFQRWDNGKSTIDVTPFDRVVSAAEKNDIKLLVALTNNWADYGGSDVYVVNLGGQYHDDVSFRPSQSLGLSILTPYSFTRFLESRTLLSVMSKSL